MTGSNIFNFKFNSACSLSSIVRADVGRFAPLAGNSLVRAANECINSETIKMNNKGKNKYVKARPLPSSISRKKHL